MRGRNRGVGGVESTSSVPIRWWTSAIWPWSPRVNSLLKNTKGPCTRSYMLDDMYDKHVYEEPAHGHTFCHTCMSNTSPTLRSRERRRTHLITSRSFNELAEWRITMFRLNQKMIIWRARMFFMCKAFGNLWFNYWLNQNIVIPRGDCPIPCGTARLSNASADVHGCATGPSADKNSLGIFNFYCIFR